MIARRVPRNGGRRTTAVCTLLCAMCSGTSGGAGGSSGFRVAFGSCNKADRPQPLWRDVLSRKPDLWIWGGDNVYLDSKYMLGKHRMATPERIESQYRLQLQNPDYMELVKSTTVLGTWDDHDYGHNNGGWDLPIKSETRSAFLDFIEVEQTPDPVRRTREDGIYSARVIQDTGKGGRPVGVILLDERWNKGGPDSDAPFLGSAQWAWFEETLAAHTKADVGLTFVVTSLTALPQPRAPFESWDVYPKERLRLLRLLASAGHPTLMLSGDVHLGEMSSATCAAPGTDEPVLVFEVTASGMTHTHGDGWISSILMSVLRELTPFPHTVGYTLQHHYGELDIDWAKGTLSVTLRGEGNTPLLNQVLNIDDLHGRVPEADRDHVECVPLYAVSRFRLYGSLGLAISLLLSLILFPVFAFRHLFSMVVMGNPHPKAE
eukprot:m.67710 g.67710  ORF g.67710 m.67710 type:complete len:433 (+) comp9876_c0_seq1:2927-4225(+)